MRRLVIIVLVVVVLVIVFFHTRQRVDAQRRVHTRQQVQTQQQVQQSVTGIGTELADRHGAVEIENVLPNTPAARAGLHRGVIIQEIDGTDVSGKSLKMCAEMVRGPVGSTVRLRVFDPANNETNVLEFTREKITIRTGGGAVRAVPVTH